MRIILSRKGFDSANGGVPSPIFPSGEMRSLPILQPNSSCLRVPIRYHQITHNGRPLEGIVSDLTGGGQVTSHDPAHLDPDLDAQSLPRQAGWRPVFGQNQAAESDLRNQRVKAGDIFLFFGWFKRVNQSRGPYPYDRDAPDLHVIFGWLQVERRIITRLVRLLAFVQPSPPAPLPEGEESRRCLPAPRLQAGGQGVSARVALYSNRHVCHVGLVYIGVRVYVRDSCVLDRMVPPKVNSETCRSRGVAVHIQISQT